MTPDRRTEAMSQVQPIIQAAEQAATGIIEDAEERARLYVEESRRRADQIAKERAEDLWNLTDGLIERAESVKKQSDELLTALNQTRRGAEAAIQAGPGPIAPDPPAPSAARVVEPPPEPPPPPAPPPPPPPPAPEAAAAPEPVVAPAPAVVPGPPPAVPPPPVVEEVAPSAAPVPEQDLPPVFSGARTAPPDEAKLLATQMAVAGGDRSEIASRLQDEFGIQDPGPVLDEILGPAQG